MSETYKKTHKIEETGRVYEENPARQVRNKSGDVIQFSFSKMGKKKRFGR